jgi:hypothetical protein
MKKTEEVGVVLVTCAEFPALPADDHLLVEELHRWGLRAEPVVWDDPDFDWSQAKVCVLRSTWDYTTRRAEFLLWAERVAAVTALWNPLEVIRWNTHKSYLRHLAEAGVAVAPTVWLEAGSRVDLPGLMAEHGWTDAVVKPVVALSARETIRVTAHSPMEGQTAVLRSGGGRRGTLAAVHRRGVYPRHPQAARAGRFSGAARVWRQ